jgi:hypothetical protein
VAGVCRNWRGRYLTLTRNTRQKFSKTMRPPHTSCDSIMMTAARLQLAQANMQQFAQMLQAISAEKDASRIDMVFAASFQHRDQRACGSHDSIPVLARTYVLDTVFSFVGIGEYYYAAGVCRNWRGRYIQLCAQTAANKNKKFNTSLGSVVATKVRLQLALDNGLTIEQLEDNEMQLPDAVVRQSLEPMRVIALARLYGLEWNDYLTEQAADHSKYELLKWLHKCGCPWDVDDIIDNACDRDNLEHLTAIHDITGPWPVEIEERCGIL